MPDFDLCFSEAASEELASFRLLELPPELAVAVDAALQKAEPLQLAIKGSPAEDAVLCTHNKTYTLRSVALSNSLLVVTAPQSHLTTGNGREPVVIRDELHEVIELLPAVPKLHKLSMLLRGKEYDESDEIDHESRENINYYSYQDAKNEIQASEAELERGLKEKKILVINGVLRPISQDYLQNVLELILNLLVSLAVKHDNVPLEELVSVLAHEHDVSRTVSLQIMSWFGDLNKEADRWRMDVQVVMKAVALGILRHYRRNPIEKDAFINKWKTAVGDSFESVVNLGLLSGNYLITTPDTKDLLTYFPSSELPVDPAARFADLFHARSRWKGDDITPFLEDIAVNSKERDKLLLKYCRAITSSQGVLYTTRTQYSG